MDGSIIYASLKWIGKVKNHRSYQFNELLR